MLVLPDAPVLLAFTLAGLVLFVTPGPDMSLWLARTLQGGTRAGLATAMGTNAGCVVHSLLAAFGISVLIVASPVAFGVLRVVGAGYLLWLAWGAIRHGSTLPVGAAVMEPREMPVWPSFLTGLGVNLANPKVVLFFLTFLPGFVTATDPDATGKLLFLGLWFVAMNVVLSGLFVLSAGRLVRLLRANPRVLRVIDWLFAGVFGLFAAVILRAKAH